MRGDTLPSSLHSLHRGVSPPPTRSSKRRRLEQPSPTQHSDTVEDEPFTARSNVPTPAAVEAGQVTIKDHLSYFTTQLSKFNRHPAGRLTVDAYKALYLRNAGSSSGHHFVIHQHDHPRAGTHYDLRLQINEDSSCSWAIPYGLPGNPNERRHGRRQGIETRVHCLWNHLIEAASHATGSMLIWDTGEYEVLPVERRARARMTDDEGSGTDDHGQEGKEGVVAQTETEAAKLGAAFRKGKIRLRLRGSKLPPGYTVSLSLSRDAKTEIPSRLDAGRSMAKEKGARQKRVKADPMTTDEDTDREIADKRSGPVDLDTDDEDNRAEYGAVRANNAYPGARNTIGSVHQRWWFVSIDKLACGFMRGKDDNGHVLWTPKNSITARHYPFHVRGRDIETSTVTGRKAADVLKDEGVENYRFREGWKPIMN